MCNEKHVTVAAVLGLLFQVVLAPATATGKEPDVAAEPAIKASQSTPGPRPTTYEGSGPPPRVGASEETAAGEMWGDSNFAIPFIEVVTFEAVLNLYDRTFLEKEIYATDYASFERNLTTAPELDADTFQINQLYHPYQGAMYFGFGRSAGLSYWQSLAYGLGGSELWETAGEKGPPSLNDHIASGIGGGFLGEPLFRMASLVLEGGGRRPGILREVGAACICPSLGINRLLFGERFDKVFPNHNPPIFLRLRLGVSSTARQSDNGPLRTFNRQQETLDFLLAYGLPGKPGYTYDRPFDYFQFEFSAGTGRDSFQNIVSRGLLYGSAYDIGDPYRGVFGLFGTYDYISSDNFRVSSTALSLGTTAQWWMTDDAALQYTALGGAGYAAAGTVRGTGERDYRYGTTPQALLSLRFIMANRAMLDMTGREYYISDTWGSSPGGHEQIGRGSIGLTVRLHGQHGIGIQGLATSRDSASDGSEVRHQQEEVLSFFYVLLGNTDFGAVEW